MFEKIVSDTVNSIDSLLRFYHLHVKDIRKMARTKNPDSKVLAKTFLEAYKTFQTTNRYEDFEKSLNLAKTIQRHNPWMTLNFNFKHGLAVPAEKEAM